MASEIFEVTKKGFRKSRASAVKAASNRGPPVRLNQ
jgi:hypothetical protein